MKKSFLIPVLALFLAAVSCSGESGETAENQHADRAANGEHASIVENAVFTDLDGNDVNISEFAGSVVLIDFWESWCGPCLQVFPAMQDIREEHPEKFEVLAVTVGMNEGPEEARAFAEEHGYDFNFLYDEYGVFAELGGQGIPFKAYVGPDGEFIKLEVGSYGRQGDYDRALDLISEYFEL